MPDFDSVISIAVTADISAFQKQMAELRSEAEESVSKLKAIFDNAGTLAEFKESLAAQVFDIEASLDRLGLDYETVADRVQTSLGRMQAAQADLAANPGNLGSLAALRDELNGLTDGLAQHREILERAGDVRQTATAAVPTPGSVPTAIPVPGSDKSYQGQYAVRELSEIQTSHSGETFLPNPQYPYKNDRDYSNPTNAERVVRQSQAFDPNYLINTNPDAVNGPPIVDPRGNVLGGNSRAMTLERVYANHPEGAQQYRDLLAQKASTFGLDPNQIAGMKQPVLVRQLSEQVNPQEAITDLNKVGTASLTSSERAVSDSRRLSPETLSHLGQLISSEGDEGTLAKVLSGAKGPSVIQKLIDDGVISPQERGQYLDERNQVTPEGKQRVTRSMVGRFFDSPDEYENAPPELRNKLERVAGPVSSIEDLPGCNIAPQTKGAVNILSEAKNRGIPNLSDLEAQSSLFGGSQYHPDEMTLARVLQQGPRKAQDAFQQYAGEANSTRSGEALFAEATPKPGESFDAAFRKPVGAEETGQLESRVSQPVAPAEVTPSPVLSRSVAAQPVAPITQPIPAAEVTPELAEQKPLAPVTQTISPANVTPVLEPTPAQLLEQPVPPAGIETLPSAPTARIAPSNEEPKRVVAEAATSPSAPVIPSEVIPAEITTQSPSPAATPPAAPARPEIVEEHASPAQPESPATGGLVQPQVTAPPPQASVPARPVAPNPVVASEPAPAFPPPEPPVAEAQPLTAGRTPPRSRFEESGGQFLTFPPHEGAAVPGDFLSLAAHPAGTGEDEGWKQLRDFKPHGTTHWPGDLEPRLAQHNLSPENLVGYSLLRPDAENPAALASVGTHVSENFRRQGVATGMYDAAEQAQSERIGQPAQLRPSASLSEDAQAFWQARQPQAAAPPEPPAPVNPESTVNAESLRPVETQRQQVTPEQPASANTQAAAPPAPPPPPPPSAPPAAPPPDDDEERKRAAREKAAQEEKAQLESVANTRKEVSAQDVASVEQSLSKQTSDFKQASQDEKSSIQDVQAAEDKKVAGPSQEEEVSSVRKASEQEIAAEREADSQRQQASQELASIQERVSQESAASVKEATQQATSAFEQGTAEQKASAEDAAASEQSATTQSAETAQESSAQQTSASEQVAESQKQASKEQAQSSERAASAERQSSQARIQSSQNAVNSAKEGAGSVAAAVEETATRETKAAQQASEAQAQSAVSQRVQLAQLQQQHRSLAAEINQRIASIIASENQATDAASKGQQRLAQMYQGGANEQRAALDGVIAKQDELAAAIARTKKEMEGAGTVSYAKVATEIGALTGSTGRLEFGLARVLSASKAIAPILEAAFPILGALGFAEILVDLGEKVHKYYEDLVHLKTLTENLEKAQMDLAAATERAVEQEQRLLIQKLQREGKPVEAAQQEETFSGQKPIRLPQFEAKTVESQFKEFSTEQQDFLKRFAYIPQTEIAPRIREVQDEYKKAIALIQELKKQQDEALSTPSEESGPTVLVLQHKIDLQERYSQLLHNTAPNPITKEPMPGIQETLQAEQGATQAQRTDAAEHVLETKAQQILRQANEAAEQARAQSSVAVLGTQPVEKPIPVQPGGLSDLITQQAQRSGVPPQIALAVAQQESGTQQTTPAGDVVTSKKGALGVMQLMPQTAADLGVDPKDAAQNIKGGIEYLRQLFQKYGDWAKAIAAYNAGPAAVDSGKPLPRETQDYVASVTARAALPNTASPGTAGPESSLIQSQIGIYRGALAQMDQQGVPATDKTRLETQTKIDALTVQLRTKTTEDLQHADQEAFADLQADHKLTIEEVIAFWEKRLQLEKGYADRVREIKRTLGHAHQEQDTQQERTTIQSEDLTAKGFVTPEGKPDSSKELDYWNQIVNDAKQGSQEYENALRHIETVAPEAIRATNEEVKKSVDAQFENWIKEAHRTEGEIQQFWQNVGRIYSSNAALVEESLRKATEAAVKFREETLKSEEFAITVPHEQRQDQFATRETQIKGTYSLSMGSESDKTHELTALRSLHAEELQEEQRFLLQMAQLDSLNGNDKGAEKALEQLLQAQRRYHQQILQDNIQLTQQMEQRWKQMFQTINQGFTQGVNQWLTGQQKFSTSMAKLWDNMVLNFADHLLQMVLQWAENELLMTIVHTTANQVRVASDASAASQSQGISLAEHVKEAAADAKLAAAHAFTAVVGIPVVGPILAPVAAAAAFTAVMALASFDEGGIVPNTGVAMVHGGEMVLPTDISQSVQESVGKPNTVVNNTTAQTGGDLNSGLLQQIATNTANTATALGYKPQQNANGQPGQSDSWTSSLLGNIKTGFLNDVTNELGLPNKHKDESMIQLLQDIADNTSSLKPGLFGTFGGIGGILSLLGFADGGIVPDDTLAMVHANEMVLPAYIASHVMATAGGNVYRDMPRPVVPSIPLPQASSSTSLSRSLQQSIANSKGGDIHNHIHAPMSVTAGDTTMTSDDFKSHLTAHKDHLGRLVSRNMTKTFNR